MHIGTEVTYSGYEFRVVGVPGECMYGHCPEGSVAIRNASGVTIVPVSELVRVPHHEDNGSQDIGAMRALLGQVEEIHNVIDQIATDFVTKKVREMSKKYKNRTFHFDAGMGSSCLFMEFGDAMEQVYGTWSTCRAFKNGLDWIDALDKISENIGNGCSSLPFGCAIKYRNGEEVK